ncbi:MAG TPA: ABC transporter permease [Streptosporangiaceae bacterium]|jgi:peptide/nickel transport system permease protein|nr:ABC transporter permease [Streptosporangiaceae bacterium]
MSMILAGESPGATPGPEATPEGGTVAAGGSPWRAILSVFIQNRLAIVGVAIVIAMVLFSFVGPLLYHTDQVHTNLGDINAAPGGSHPLGTDDVGYDVLGRLMLSGQSSLLVGLAAALLATVVGTLWGAVAGYVGGAIDAVMMRIVDSVLAIPPLILILLLASVFRPNTWTLILVVAIVSWLAPARLVRGEAISLRTREYVQAATAMGGRRGWIVLRHITPNAIGTIVVQATFEVANAILLLAALSYLGLGPAPPATNWGSMLSNGLNYMYEGKWWLIYPAGLAIVLTVVAFNFIGDAMRAALEVRLRER